MKPSKDLHQSALFGNNGVITSDNIDAPSGATSTFTISNTQEDSSKQMTIMTANNSSSSLGSASLEIKTGNAGSGNSGDLTLGTGTSSGSRGSIVLDAEELDLNGMSIVNAGYPTDDNDVATKAYVDSSNGGQHSLITPDNDEEDSSDPTLDIEIRTGAVTDDGSSGDSGNVTIDTGDNSGAGDSGDIHLATGSSVGGQRGDISLDANQVDLNSSKIVNLADPENDQDAATKAYVDANVGGSSGVYQEIPLANWSGSLYNGSALPFTTNSSDSIETIFIIPNTYTPGDQLKLRFIISAANITTNNNFLFQGTLFPVGSDASHQTAGIPVILDSDPSAGYLTAIDTNITDGSGEIDSTAVAVGDALSISFQGTEHNPGTVLIRGIVLIT